jgi:hypothetical protein
MIAQYSEDIPCVRIDADQKRVCFEPAEKLSALERFYASYLEDDPSLFPISGAAAAGLYAFEPAAHGRQWPIVKGQTTGPITLCTSIQNDDKLPLYGDPELRDAAVKTVVRKVQWQIDRLKPFASECVLMFVDEPVLAAYGSSSYLYLSEEDVLSMLGEVFAAITDAGCVSAIHVCGNSDWGMIARSGVQVVNFDAYQYGTSMSLYPNEVQALFDRGGSIAWGIVPTTTAVNGETTESLVRRLQQCFDAMSEKGFSAELVRERALLTPSCGAGNLTAAEARRVFDLLAQVRSQVLAKDKE